MNIRQNLIQLISIPSPTGQETAIQAYLAKALKNIGLEVQLQQVFHQRHNIIAHRNHGKLLLCTHVDTIPPYNHPQPYQPQINQDKIIGRGAADAKGQITALLEALCQSQAPCTIALVVDEENAGKGSEALPLNSRQIEAAVVLEPTDLKIAICEAGSIDLQIQAKGKATHSAMVSTSTDNAILNAFKLAEKLKSLDFLKTQHQFFTKPWINLGVIQGGITANIIPDSCRLNLQIAILPNVDIRKAQATLEDFLKTQKANYTIQDISPPFCISQEEKVVKKLSQSYQAITHQTPTLTGMPSWTDAENLVGKGIPTVVFGAGTLSAAHSNYEWIEISQLQLLSQILTHFIDHWEETESL